MKTPLLRTAILSLFILLFLNVSAGSDGLFVKKTEEDKIVIDALKQLFTPNNYKISGLGAGSTADGGKLLSGKVSFFGADNVDFEATVSADKKVKSISATFPASASFPIIKSLNRLVPTDQLRNRLPTTFLNDPSLHIKNFTLNLGPDGKSLSSFEATINSTEWDFMGYGGFKMREVGMTLSVTNSGGNKQFGGKVNGKVSIGSSTLDVSTTLPKNKADWVITGDFASAGNLTLGALLTSIGGQQLRNDFAAIAPNPFADNIKIPSFSLTAKPGTKEMTLSSSGSAGGIELKLQGMGNSSKFLFTYSTPNPFKFASISQNLAWIDGAEIQLQDVKISVGNMPGSKKKVMQRAPVGMNIEATIVQSSSPEFFGKSNQPTLKFVGGINSSFSVYLAMQLGLDMEITSGWKLEDVSFYIESLSGSKPELGMDGSLIVRIDNTNLRFAVNGNTRPSSTAIGMGFELESVNNDGSLKEWREPFGIPYLTFVKIGGGAGVSGQTLIEYIDLKGDLKLGKIPSGSTDHRISGRMATHLDTDINKCRVSGSIKNINVLSIIRAFDDRISVGGEVQRFLDVGIDSAMIDINIPEKMLKLHMDANFWGVRGKLDIDASKSGINAHGFLDPIELKTGDFVLFGIHGFDGASTPSEFLINLNTSDPAIMINCKATALGIISAGTKMKLDKSGFELDVNGKLMGGAVEANVHVHGRDFKNSADIEVSVEIRQTILKQIRETVVNLIKGDSEGSMPQSLRNKIKNNSCSIEDVPDLIKYCVMDATNVVRNTAALVVDQILGAFDIRSISFTAGLKDVKARMKVEIEFVTNIGGSEKSHILSIEIQLDLNDLNAFLKQIGEVIKREILKAFEYLGKELIKVGKAIADGLEEFADFCEDAGKEVAGWFGVDTGPSEADMEAARKKVEEARKAREAQRKAEAAAITKDVIMAAVRAKDDKKISEYVQKGANMKVAFVDGMNHCVKARDGHMARTLYMLGANFTDAHMKSLREADPYPAQFIAQTMYFGAKPTAADVTVALEKNQEWLAWEFYRKQAPATVEHMRFGLKKKNYALAKYALTHGAKPDQTDLENAIKQKDLHAVDLLIDHGCVANVGHLNKSIEDRQYNMARTFLKSVKPTNETYTFAAQTNYPSFFREVLRSEVKITNVEPAKAAIDVKNTEILVMCLQNGVKAQEAMNYATRKFNFPAAKQCVFYGGNPNQVVGATISKNDFGFYKQLIKDYGADGSVAAQAAYRRDKYEYFKFAIEEGNANPSKQMKDASDNGKFKYVNLMLDNGGNPDLAMPGVVEKEAIETLQKCLDFGGNPNVPAYLEKSTSKNNTQMTKMLVEYGAAPDPGMKNAINHNNTESVKLLLAYGANPAGHLATPSSRGKMEIVQELLDYGGDPNEGMKGATSNLHTPVVKTLLEYGAKPDGYMATPAQKGNIDIVRMLCDYGADPNEGIKGAVVGNHTHITKFLLEYGAIPKDLVKIGAKNGNVEIVTLLCDYGDDPEPGMLPACENAHLPVVQLLHQKYNVDPTKEAYLVGAVTNSENNSHSGVVHYLLENGSDPNTYRDPKKGYSLLHIACDNKRDDQTVKSLLGYNADINAVDNKGWTPLHRAVERGKKNFETTVLLVEAGADINACTYKFKSVLKIADGIKVSKYLKEHGAEKEGCKAMKKANKAAGKN